VDVCRSAESELQSLVTVASKLESLAGAEDRVRYVVRAKTMPISQVYPDSPVRQASDVLGLSHATSFTVTDHACASGLLAVDMCGMLLAADGDPDALALVLLGEKAFTHIARAIPDVAVMGEGFAAVLVSAGGTGNADKLLGYATRTHSDAAGSLAMTPAQAEKFRLSYHDALAEVVHAALGVAGLPTLTYFCRTMSTPCRGTARPARSGCPSSGFSSTTSRLPATASALIRSSTTARRSTSAGSVAETAT
jgi:3-oxoacyl-[acyl-carrier-protein] synthase-3